MGQGPVEVVCGALFMGLLPADPTLKKSSFTLQIFDFHLNAQAGLVQNVTQIKMVKVLQFSYNHALGRFVIIFI